MVEELWFRFKFYLMQLANFQKRNRLQRYGFCILLIAVIFPLIIFLPKPYFQLIHSQTVSFLILILIVATSSWYGGLGPGIVATILTSVLNYFLLLKEDFLTTFIYIFVGFLISLISEARYEAEFQKDEFVALAAHEIKNPLSIIKGYAGLLRQHFKKNDIIKFSGYIDEMDIQAERLLELINDLLDVTKIEVGKFVYKDELFDFDGLIKKIVSHQQIINHKREIIITGCANKIIKGDEYRIGQVVTNLLTNAIKYSPQKNPIRVRVKSSRVGVVLIVKDYGIGIARSEQKEIFRHFYRSGRIRKGGAEGLGLGLFISSQIIKHHRGKLWVESNGLKGSAFHLEIPKNY